MYLKTHMDYTKDKFDIISLSKKIFYFEKDRFY